MSDQANPAIKAAFERYIVGALQAAVDFLGEDTDADTIWIYTAMSPDTISTFACFSISGQFYKAQDVPADQHDPEWDGNELINELDPETDGLDLLDSFEGAQEVPDRIVTRYRVVEGGMASEWEYDVLDPTNPDDNADDARDRWIKKMGGKPIFRHNQ